MDFDHVFVKSEKADAKYSYKQAYGYFPGVVSIDGIVAVSDELINIVTMFAARTTRRLLKRTKRHEIGRVSRGAVCPPADGSPRVFFMVFFEYQRKKMVRK